MKRLYYMTADINALEQASNTLHNEGIDDWNIHVLCKDKAALARRDLHATTPIQELDIVRSGERGALLGIAVGVIVIPVIAIFFSVGGDISPAAQLASVFVLACFGAWIGGLVGISSENYKIRRFHHDIEQGKYLLMIDIDISQRLRIEKMMAHFLLLEKSGEDSTFINPFDMATTA